MLIYLRSYSDPQTCLLWYKMKSSSIKNIIFYGTDTLSTAVLSKIHTQGYNISAVTKHSTSPVYQFCQKHGVPVEVFRKSELPFGRSSSDYSGHLGVVASFGHMIPGRVIRSMSHGFVNIHPSLVPKYQVNMIVM